MKAIRISRRVMGCIMALCLLATCFSTAMVASAADLPEVYVQDNETYHAISGFETDDAAMSFAAGVSATDVKNNGNASHKLTVGDNTSVNAQISFHNGNPQLAGAAYVQFWVNNTAAADQYIAGLNFLGSGIQFNVPAGKQAILIDDATETARSVTYANVRISGLGTIRTLCIPAGFSGYIRISLAQSDLEIKAGTYGDDALNSFTKMSFYLGNTSTGGNLYVDDFGYITVEAVEAVSNPIYTGAEESYYPITGFETEDVATVNIGVLGTKYKNNGYNSRKFTVGDDTFVSSTFTLNTNYPLSEAAYLQFWLKNTADTDQYLMGMNFQGSGFQYNVPAGKDAVLITDGDYTKTTVTWTNIRINGANTIRTLKIPAGFTGYVRVSLLPEDLEVRAPAGGAYDAATFDTVKYMTLLFGNTSTGGDIYMDDMGYVVDPNAGKVEELTPPPVPVDPVVNPIYTEKNDTYHPITGFEAEDVATVNLGELSSTSVNNGYNSHKFTVGDNTFASAHISFNATYPLAEAPYFQVWVHNAASTEQYLLAMSFQGEDFQYNVPTGAPAWLITDGQKTEHTWKNVKINGGGTMRGLAIPAGFSGYVRVSLNPKHLEAKVGSYSPSTFNQAARIALYLGNTATGGDIYFDDLGYITNPGYNAPTDEEYTSASNAIYLEKNETYHAITGFETADTVTSDTGVPVVDVKNNGYRSYRYTLPDNTYDHVSLKLRSTYPFASAQYLQLWVSNTASTSQYLLSVSLQGDGLHYNVPSGAPVWLITGGKKTEKVWENIKINGGGTMRGLEIPAGFSGYVRISLQPEHLVPKFGTYNAGVINKATRIGIYMGNTGKGGNLYFDDLGYITNPAYTGLVSNTTVSNTVYVGKGETFHEITGFEADDRTASNTGVPGIDVKNNGYQSHRYTVGDDTFMKAELIFNNTYPLSDAQYVQFWLNNSTGTDQYLLNMSFQGDGFQYNVPTGVSAYLIAGGKQTETVWKSLKINGAGTVRGVLIPAGFSGYVRVPVSLYDLQPKEGRYEADTFDKTARMVVYIGNTGKGGHLYFDDIGYITHANMPVPDYERPGELANNKIFLNEGDSTYLLTGFELDESTSVSPFNRQHHNTSGVKNNGYYSYQFTLPDANFVSCRVKFDSTEKLATSEYLQFWISNPSNNNIYLFNFSFTDGGSFQYNIKDNTDVILISDEEGSEPLLAQWSHPNIGTFKGQSLVIPLGFSGYVRIPISAETLSVKTPEDGKFSAQTLAASTQMAFYIGNIEKTRAVYMDDVMLIDGEIMETPEEEYDVDYSMDAMIALYGQLLDAQGRPLKNATLLLDNDTFTRTDSNGCFVFQGVSMACHTLSVLDENNKVYAQTALTIMPGDKTEVLGSYITKHTAATNLIVNLQIMGGGIKIVSVAEGSLEVQKDTPCDSNTVTEEPQTDIGWIWWVVLAAVLVAAAAVAFLLIMRARKKQASNE